MGRPSNAAQRRRQIIEATVRVMARTGFDGASIQAIAAEAGLSAGLLHHHFGSKAEILHSLPEHLEAVVEARHRGLMDLSKSTDPWGRLEAWIDAHLAHGPGAQPAAAAAWVWLGAQALKDEGLRVRYEAVVQRRLERLVELLDQLVDPLGERAEPAEGRIDTRSMAVTTLAAIEGYYQLAASTGGVVTPGSAAPQLRQWLRQALGPVAREAR